MALFLLLLLSLVVDSALSARIVGFCILGGSEYMNTRNVMEELASRGHEVKNKVSIVMHKPNEGSVAPSYIAPQNHWSTAEE